MKISPALRQAAYPVAILGQRNFTLVWGSIAQFQVGSQMEALVLGWFVIQLTDSPYHFPPPYSRTGDNHHGPGNGMPLWGECPRPGTRQEGVSDALIDAIRERQPLPAMAADEKAIVDYATEFFRPHQVS